jgi:hypothetical protein
MIAATTGPKPFYLTTTESARVSIIMHFRVSSCVLVRFVCSSTIRVCKHPSFIHTNSLYIYIYIYIYTGDAYSPHHLPVCDTCSRLLQKYTYMYTYIYTYLTYMHTLHTCTLTYMHTLHTCTLTYIHTLRTCTLTYIHTLHTCTLTYIHTLQM